MNIRIALHQLLWRIGWRQCVIIGEPLAKGDWLYQKHGVLFVVPESKDRTFRTLTKINQRDQQTIHFTYTAQGDYEYPDCR